MEDYDQATFIHTKYRRMDLLRCESTAQPNHFYVCQKNKSVRSASGSIYSRLDSGKAGHCKIYRNLCASCRKRTLYRRPIGVIYSCRWHCGIDEFFRKRNRRNDRCPAKKRIA
uniref:Uncharacterized protein n=1 Tax=Romanomermis culicivorax TaxID=13658 RepID=A0A915IMN9_ROMCU